MKYSEIKDIESLDAARKALTSKIDRKGRRVVSSWEDFCDSYSPSGLIAGIEPYHLILGHEAWHYY